MNLPLPPPELWQDQEDDAKLGIKSTALTFGSSSRSIMSAFAVGTVALLGWTGWVAGSGPAYYGGVAAAAAQIAWQLATVDLNNRSDAGAKFNSNKWFGAAVFAGIMGDKLLAYV